MLFGQTRFERILAQYQDWLLDGAVFLGTLLGFYLFARFLIVPFVVRVVRSRNRNNPTLVNAVRLYLRIVIVVLGVPVAIAAAGFGGVAAGSGIVLAAATLAFGVAGRDVIGNLVSGVFLVADRDFNVGDYIEWAERAGTVETIGLRVTRVRSEATETLIVPNTQLTTETVSRPFGGARYRLTESLDVAYTDDVAAVRRELTAVAREMDRVLREPTPTVHVTGLGESTVEITVWLWIANPSPARLADVRTAFRTAAATRLTEAGVSLAPTPERDLSGDLTIERRDGER